MGAPGTVDRHDRKIKQLQKRQRIISPSHYIATASPLAGGSARFFRNRQQAVGIKVERNKRPSHVEVELAAKMVSRMLSASMRRKFILQSRSLAGSEASPGDGLPSARRRDDWQETDASPSNSSFSAI